MATKKGRPSRKPVAGKKPVASKKKAVSKASDKRAVAAKKAVSRHEAPAREAGGGPLAGIKIVDLSTVVFGPYATMLLADLGADVVRIETGAGDIVRYAGGGPARGMGGIFMSLNRNKRFVKLDLRLPAAKEAVRRMIATADVFFHNIRAGGIARLGFSYDDVRAINENIVYVHGVGFGSAGLYAGRQAYDDLVQAASGFADLHALRDGREPEYAPSIVADKTAALHAVYATLAGLFHRERTGEGQFIEVPMMETFTMFNLVENLYRKAFVPPAGSMGYARSINPNRKPYPTKDGFIAIVPYNDHQWAHFFELGGRPKVMEDPRFATYEKRTEHIGELYALIREVSATKTTEEWLELLHLAHIPAMRYNTLDDVLEEPHLKSVDFFVEREHPEVGRYLAMRHPVSFARTPATIRRDPRPVGADTAAVLREYGMSEEDVADLTAGEFPRETDAVT